MTCKEFLASLDDLIDGSVSAETRAELQAHLGRCGHCEVILNTTRKTIEIYRSHELYDLPAGLHERLHAAIMARCKNGCWSRATPVDLFYDGGNAGFHAIFKDRARLPRQVSSGRPTL